MIRYGLIQLSDLQFGNQHRFEFPSKIVNPLCEDIMSMSEKHKFIPIYLLLTGDIAETAHANEFKDASDSINRIALKIGIDKDSILAIPGNHDINWKLSEIASQVGDSNLKYNLYNKFSESSCNKILISI
jgi:3',5'-cyclic AMP phosphodiesterase CpdA